MKINSGNIDRKKLPKKTTTASSSEPASPLSGFREILESIIPSSTESNRTLNEMWSSLPDVEKRFLAAPSRQNLEEYRALIKDILQDIQRKNVKIETAQRKNRNDERVLRTVRIVNEKLQILAKIIIDPNNAAFQKLKEELHDIRGLLLDIK